MQKKYSISLNTKQNSSAYFHQSRRPRVNNPTFVSSHMTDSLTILHPPHDYTKTLSKETEYKKNFETVNGGQNSFGVDSTVRSPSMYAKYSKAAFEKNRSMMSNYGATILRESNRLSIK